MKILQELGEMADRARFEQQHARDLFRDGQAGPCTDEAEAFATGTEMALRWAAGGTRHALPPDLFPHASTTATVWPVTGTPANTEKPEPATGPQDGCGERTGDGWTCRPWACSRPRDCLLGDHNDQAAGTGVEQDRHHPDARRRDRTDPTGPDRGTG
ncbi:hypothetical protein [Dactylosporangium sp. CA-139066]|uniref:hypothetical protein n=1 Tax=Dactylosporangium sp. CA-139066 TaxID=3239930 RepID=UPI003D94514C